MFDREGIDENFRFLVHEVVQQVERARGALNRHDVQLVRAVRRRDDYVDYLRTLIDNRCFELLRGDGDLQPRAVDDIRSLDTIAINLERIADHAVSVVDQWERYEEPHFADRYDYDAFFDIIVDALERVLDAQGNRNPMEAMQIARAELDLDELYERKFQRILVELGDGEDSADLVTSLFLFHYLERMGDCLQNIGEAILSSKVGERMKVYQYRNLRDSLAAAQRVGSEGPELEEVSFEGIWGTRSGNRIGKVSDVGPGDEDEVVFKEGDPEKISLEKENAERWQEVIPGLPPRVIDYREDGPDAAILMEFLEGETLFQLALDSEPGVVREAVSALCRTLRRVWSETKEDREVRADFVAQLRERLTDIYSVHPEFRKPHQQIGTLETESFGRLVDRCAPLDEEFVAPFSVFGHGDFNLDNVIFDRTDGSIHFIDLHRSRRLDYVQDVAVFLVSNFRVPAPDPERRSVLNGNIRSFFEFSRKFAREEGDATFSARLALGLARNFATSSRFEFERSFAADMFERSEYLLRRLEAHREAGASWPAFELPTDVLTY